MPTKAPQAIIFDFETAGVQGRPHYPPKPVSLALKWPNQSTYKLMAWGHADGSKAAGNNCTEKEARAELVKAYNSRYPIVTQYGTFDHDVAEVHWQLPVPEWQRLHDTLYLIFLNNPHSESLGLKQVAESLLGIPPEEQDSMKEWILENIPEAKKRPSTYGAYICECPYQIVKPYHKGDLTRTGALFNYLYPLVIDAGMGEAYDRERRLMPILLENARVGMRVDVDGLASALPEMKEGVARADAWMKKKLGNINLDSPKQFGEALLNKGIVRDFKRTAKGQLSTSKKNLTLDKYIDKQFYQVWTYRSQMDTSITMFVEPWLELVGTGDRLYPNWSQVRSPKGDSNDTKGARSGRVICAKPNFLNIPKKWKKAISAGYVHPAFLKVPELPFIRKYVLPDLKQVWGRRDFNQQELRLFGHFEEGPVMEGFLTDPDYDIHELARAEEERQLIEAGLRDSFDRDTAKGTVFGRLYGQGVKGLMHLLQLNEEEKPVAQLIQKAINTAIPSIKELDNALKALAKEGRPIRTWGSRLYYCEEPKYNAEHGYNMTFEYKLLNYLCQGSGADVTKETLIRYNDHPKRRGRLVVTVYDEINFSCPKPALRSEMTVLRDVMRSIETDIPMLSDGETGPNWGNLTKFPV